ncbi:mitogen activated protein kinase kinase kinase [Echinococcus multilocularis]|uniref:non-specific serine/threonine protein kinase n=1 Tax=Echinococcus multilocularis TaxID=6211 RepID=A0A068Y7X6_ECHMU|nr:mitogen activated protein kinase kinase kinase [Echinococcus multilocularis]
MSVHCLISEQKLDYIREVVNQRDPKEDYKLIRSIGVGTYGEALRLNTKDYAAVKIIKVDAKDDIKAVLQEIQTLRDCRHRNIVEFYDSYFRHNKLWICMEFCGGYSMQDIYTMDEDCIAFLSRETLRGIAYMHSQGKIHRDIKGANILLCNDGAVKIADFGVAAQITHTIQRRNSLIGTPYWMAPEVVAVERKGGYDEKCDIWAVGITAIEYAELQPPMFDLNPLKALRILSMKNYKPPTLRNKSKWSNKFHGFLKFALTKNEKKRPTASLTLTHEFVTQPQLSQALTLRLLQQNRNPEPITFGQPREAVEASAAAPPVASPSVQPHQVNQVAACLQSLRSPFGLAVKRPTPANALATNGSAAMDSATPKVSHVLPEGVNIKTPATRFPFSSAALEAASKYVATHQEEMGVAPASKPKMSQVPPPLPIATNGVPERILPTPAGGSVYPRFPVRGKRLEDVRIMDELATPLPAYAANAPTASPAPKPPLPSSFSPTVSATSFSSASTSPCSTLSSSTSSSGSRSSGSSSAACEDTEEVDDEEGEREEDDDEDEVSFGGETSALLEKDRPSPHAPISVTNSIPNLDATPQPVRSAMSVPRVDAGCNGSATKSVDAAEKENRVGVAVRGMPSERGDGSESREGTLTASDFAAADLDLGVADEQLLAADGVLTLGKCSSKRTNSTGGGDRISEFGFRMRGNPLEEEEEEDDEELDFDYVDPEAGFILHPGARPAAEGSGAGIGVTQHESRTFGENDDQRPRRGKSDTKVVQRQQLRSPRRQVSESTELSAVATSMKESEKLPVQNDFFPEKTGAELADMLRQLKFAQKFAWLAGEPSAAPLGLSSFNPGSVPTLHHATSSSDMVHHFLGRSGGSGLLLPPMNPSDTEGSVLQLPSPQPRPKTSAPAMSSGSPSLSARPAPFTLSPPIAYSPFAFSSGIRSVVDLAETSIAETGTLITAATADFSAPISNGNINEEQQHPKPIRPTAPNSSEINSQSHLPGHQPTNVPSETLTVSATSRPPSPPSQPLDDQHRCPSSTADSASSSFPLPPSADPVSKLFIQHQAFTSPCFSTHSFLHHDVPSTSYSLGSRHRQNGVEQESAQTRILTSKNGGLRRVVEEEGNVRIPSGAAPLADQETEDDDFGTKEEEVKVKEKHAHKQEQAHIQEAEIETREVELPPLRSTTHPCRTCTFPNFYCAFSRTVAPSPSTCPNLLHIFCNAQPQWLRHPRKTTSAPSVTEENAANAEDTSLILVESLKAVATEPVIKKVPLVLADKHRICPPAYLSPQPSRMLRRLRQSPIDNNKVRPTSVSISSMDHALQKLSRPGGGICSSYGARRWTRQSTTDLPPTPQVHMGACFMLVFEGCPLTINSTASWINPANNGQILLFGSAEGIYFLSLKDLADRSLELLSSRYCHWLAVVQNTMVSVSGNPPHLYTHNLTTLMKMKASGHSMNAKLNRISNLFPKRFSPSNKVSKTKGCLRAGLVRSPFTGARYLCAAFPHEILVMEWVNALSTFIETKRVPVSNMPQSLPTFDLLVQQGLRFPLACLGVYRHHSRRGLAGERYRLHLVDLNAPTSPTIPLPLEPVPTLSHALSPPAATPTEPKKLTKTHSEAAGPPAAPAFDAATASPFGKTAGDIGHSNNSVFLETDRLTVVSVIQLLKNTVLVCFPDCAKLIGFSGRLRKKLRQPNTITFDGLQIQSVVGLRDSLLVFHPHGFLGKSFAGELTQEINDDKHVYRVLGHDRNIVVESRPVDGSLNNSNIYLLAGHTDNSS